jgi:parallel beta-helix repeat protein
MKPTLRRSARRAAQSVALALGGAVAVLAGGAGPATAAEPTPIFGCPYTIVAPGTYLLARDVVCPGDGIIITADNVLLVLNGRTLTGSGDRAGVRAEGTEANPTLTGLQVVGSGTVTGFDTGVLVRNAPDARVIDVTAADNQFEGIYVDTSPRALVAGNTARNNAEGIYVEDSDGSLIAGNQATGNAREFFSDGIQLDSTTGARVEGNTATGSGDDGIDLTFDSTGNLIRGNTTTGNLGSGIDVGGGSTGNQLDGNQATGNDADGNGDRDLFDANIGRGCFNTWRGNSFVTDNDGDGPGVGCIQ